MFNFVNNPHERILLRGFYNCIVKYKLGNWIKNLDLNNVYTDNSNFRVLCRGGYDTFLINYNYLLLWKEVTYYYSDKLHPNNNVMLAIFNKKNFVWFLEQMKVIFNFGYRNYCLLYPFIIELP